MTSERHTILLIEDDPDDVFHIERAFRKAQVLHSLNVVGDGEQALAYLRGEPPFDDRSANPLPMLVLLDLKLPRVTGLQVLEWLKSQPGLRRIPVVVLTSSRESRDVEVAYDLGANSYLVKPVANQALTELAHRLNLYWLLLNQTPEVGA